jgi:hypothetical protein
MNPVEKGTMVKDSRAGCGGHPLIFNIALMISQHEDPMSSPYNNPQQNTVENRNGTGVLRSSRCNDLMMVTRPHCGIPYLFFVTGRY